MLPNLCLLSLDAPMRSEKQKNRRKTPYEKKPNYSQKEIFERKTAENFHPMFNNCAAFALRVFQGFARCDLTPLWQYAPSRCKPEPGTVADVPDDLEAKRIVDIVLRGTPSFVRNFKDLLKFVETKNFTSFILFTAPNETKIKWNTYEYHAMVGLLFDDPDVPWAVTFGAYPEACLLYTSPSPRDS